MHMYICVCIHLHLHIHIHMSAYTCTYTYTCKGLVEELWGWTVAWPEESLGGIKMSELEDMNEKADAEKIELSDAEKADQKKAERTMRHAADPFQVIMVSLDIIFCQTRCLATYKEYDTGLILIDPSPWKHPGLSLGSSRGRDR